jgi:hypothetical protein
LVGVFFGGPRIAIPSFYRQKAEECRRLGESAETTAVRDSYTLLAQQWTEIAERHEREPIGSGLGQRPLGRFSWRR